MNKKCFSSLLSIGLAAGIISLVIVNPALAHHGGASAAFGPGAPVETTAPQTLPKGMFLLYERYAAAPFKKYDKFKVENGGEGNVEQFTFFSTMFGYGVNDSLSAYLLLPYAVKEQDNMGTSQGFGDLELLLQYGFKYGDRDGITGWYANGPDETAGKDYTVDDWKFVLLGSFSIPNGTTTNRTENGEVFGLTMQPGFATPSYQFGGAVSKQIFRRTTWTADTSFRAFTQSNFDKPGNEWRVNNAIGYEIVENPGGFLSRVDLLTEANYMHLTMDQTLENGKWDTVVSSGGDILYLSPAVRVTFNGRLSIGLMLKIPAWTDLNNKADQQGAEGLEKYRAVCTVSYSFR